MKPHEQPHLTLFADHLPAHDNYTRVGNASKHLVETLNVCDLLAEPDPRSGQQWGASIVRRLIAASTGPIAVGVRESQIRARLESAGWFVAAEDGNFAEARAQCWPALSILRRIGIGYGSPRPQLVLVGDQCKRFGQLPFASKAGTWLFLALRALGYDELSIYLVNARGVRGKRRTRELAKIHDALGDGPKWIALGNTPSEILGAAKIQHAKVGSPAWHRQYKHAEDVAGYAQRFLDVGVDLGPHHQAPFYRHKVTSIPMLGDPYAIRDLSSSRTARAEARKSGPTGVDPVKREVARRAYVTGEAGSIAEAGRLAGLHVDQARRAANESNWKAERDEHQRAVTEAVKAKSEKKVAKDISDALSLAWKATKLGITDVVERLLAARGEPGAIAKLQAKVDRGDAAATPLHPAPREIESLARVALALEGADVEGLSAEGARVADMPLQDLARGTLRVMGEQFGE